MKRREFITVIGGAAATWPIAAQAQQSTRPVVALINGGTADALVRQAAAFRKGLSETGYDEEKNVTVEYHLLAGQYALLPDLLDSLIRRRVAVIATPGSTPSALAAKAATTTIPIVFGVGDDSVALGLIANFAKPGGNVTGINFFAFQVTAKRLGLMHELLPKATRFAVLVNPNNAPSTESTSNEIKKAAHDLGLDVLFFKASTSAEIDAAFTAMARERVDALFIGGDSFFLGPSAICHIGDTRQVTRELSCARDGRNRPAYELWNQPCRHVSPSWHLHRQHTQRRQAHRTSGAAIDQVRIRDQSADGAFTTDRNSTYASRPRRRGDRIADIFAAAQDVRLWHRADMVRTCFDVRFLTHSGSRADAIAATRNSSRRVC